MAAHCWLNMGSGDHYLLGAKYGVTDEFVFEQVFLLFMFWNLDLLQAVFNTFLQIHIMAYI